MNRNLDFIFGIPIIKFLKCFVIPASAGVTNQAPKKILIIKLAAVGDTIILIPVLKSLREKFQSAEIHWLVSGINQSIAETVPYVNKIWVAASFSPINLFHLISKLKKEQFDVVIDFEQWSRGSAILAF